MKTGMASHRTWLSGLVLVLAFLQPTYGHMCTVNGGSQAPVRVVGKFGQALTIIGEMTNNRPTLMIGRWEKIIRNQDNEIVSHPLVTYSNRILWPDNATLPGYSATFTKGENYAFKFQFNKMTCYDRGEYLCSFLTDSATCEVKVNVTMTADPLPPVLKNDFVRGDVGSNVSVLCEANVGYPAGELLWYYFPANGDNGRRLPSDPPEIGSAGDCRFYAESTLFMELKAEDHNSQIRCSSRSGSGQTGGYTEVTIKINGLEKTTPPTPKPCVGNQCSSTGGGVTETRPSVLTCLLALVSVTLQVTVSLS